MMTDSAQPLLVPTKRRNPFGERSLAALPSAEADSATETTQVRLMSAQQSLMPLPKPACPLEHGECFVCRVNDVIMTCEFCERKSCQVHTKLCHLCTGVFCSLCSTIDYQVRYSDCAVCLTCEEDRRRRGDGSNAKNTSQTHVAWAEPLEYVAQPPLTAVSNGQGCVNAGRFFQSAPFGSRHASCN